MTKRDSPRVRWALLACVGLAAGLIGLSASSALGYLRYNDGCQNCHGDFRDGTSPKGTVFPGGNKHDMHRGGPNMGTDCALCHVAGTHEDPFIGQSEGTPNNPGVGCTGCHGRDYGGTIGHSGVGLRAHHVNAGITSCAGCHPNDPTPLPENISPVYYGTPDTNADDPCNAAPGFLEDWSIGDGLGLDNDGDLLYDGDDPDCSGVPCPPDINGDGTVDVLDLLDVLAAWGQSGVPADVNNDGIVDVLDLLEVLAAWGPCP